MATITTIASGDQITNSRSDINTNFANLNSDKIETSVIDTDTALTANSDSKIPSQKAVKAYVDTGGNVNASESAKGIVEEATDAELAAGSATGATGAKLFITPAKLIASKFSNVRTVTAGATIAGATTPVPVYQNKTDNEFYACDGNDNTKYKFLGFAISNGTDGNSFLVQFSGIVGGFTGLDEGEKYFVQDTVGTIGTSPGTQEILVGVAISTTELVIQKGQRRAMGTTTFTDSGNTGQASTTAVTTGFRPSVIRLTVVYNSSSGGARNVSQTNGIWMNGSYVSLFNTTDSDGTPGGTGGVESSIKYYSDSTGTTLNWTITITSVTDTGFTITATQNVDSPNNIAVMWESNGEF